jgi:predicted nucleic acid-binding Zn ribbon protein
MFQSMKDEPLSVCIECGAPARRRIGPGAGFLFRGDGFYITDYRSKTYKEKAKSESGGGTSAGEAAKDSSGKTSGTGKSEPAAGGTKESAKPAAEKPPKKPPQS